jgi:hypothetical protein
MIDRAEKENRLDVSSVSVPGHWDAALIADETAKTWDDYHPAVRTVTGSLEVDADTAWENEMRFFLEQDFRDRDRGLAERDRNDQAWLASIGVAVDWVDEGDKPEVPSQKPTTRRGKGYTRIVNMDMYEVEVDNPGEDEPAALPLLEELETAVDWGIDTGDYKYFLDELQRLIKSNPNDFGFHGIGHELIPTKDKRDHFARLHEAREKELLYFWFNEFDREAYRAATEPETADEVIDVEQMPKSDLGPIPRSKYITVGTDDDEHKLVHPYDAAVDLDEYLARIKTHAGNGPSKIDYREHRDMLREADPEEIADMAAEFYEKMGYVRMPDERKEETAETILDELYDREPERKGFEANIDDDRHPLVRERGALAKLVERSDGGNGLKRKPSLGINALELSPNQKRLKEIRRMIGDEREPGSFNWPAPEEDGSLSSNGSRPQVSNVRPSPTTRPISGMKYAKGPVNPDQHPTIVDLRPPVFIR